MKTRASASTARVLIASDQPLLRFALDRLLTQSDGFQVCGETDESSELFAKIESMQPDLAVIGLSLFGRGYIGLIEELRSRYSNLQIVVGTNRNDPLVAARLLQAGANGWVHWDSPLPTILDVIHAARDGKVLAATPMVAKLLQRIACGKPAQPDPAEVLSPRQLDVFTMIGQGLTVQQISRRLDLSPRTIETHRKGIKAKLELLNTAQLSRCAYRWLGDQHDLQGPALP